MALPQQGAHVTFDAIADLCDVSANTMYQASRRPGSGPGQRKRQPLVIDDLESVILWVAAHGRVPLRRKIAAYAAPSLLEPGDPGAPIVTKAERKRKAKAAK